MQGGKAQDLVVLSLALPTRQWTIWVKSEGRLDAAKVDLSGPDPKHLREESALCVRGRRAIGDCKGDGHAAALCVRPVWAISFDQPDEGQAHRAAGNGLSAAA